MKKFFGSLMTLAFLSAGSLAFHHGPCKSGHDTVELTWDDGTTTIICCVPVGDGSVASCTDGETWINL